MFVSLPILLISHKQIFFYVRFSPYSPHLSQTDIFLCSQALILLTSHKQIFFMFPSSYSPHLSQTDIFLCSQDIILPQYLTNGRIMYARFQPALSHALFLSISLYLLSYSPHIPLSCLLARLFLHSLPTLFHFHICIFTSPSLYIFSLTLRTPSPQSSFSIYPRISPIFSDTYANAHKKHTQKYFLFKNLLTIKIKSLNT